ncbi:MAG TPA: PQQ-binding-like beta-propeller repeat protein [Candidatus Baltobacteraceae bacterium]|nr:PQQ-binding-like beta-propeller repeat protein [Candidatus Baltobacteraceae bacterium]
MQDRVLAAGAAFLASLLLAGCNTSNSATTTSSSTMAASAGASVAAAGSPAAAGYFTAAQASTGATVYAGKCAACHGANLQGQSGPSLSGARFAKSLQAYGTGEQMYNFISKQMPANAPGSLSTANYLAVTAYLLQQNGYPSGSHPLDATTLASVNLSNAVSLAAANQGGTSNTNEIVRVAPPTTVDYGAPAGNVNVSDAMMSNAASDTSDWVLHGRDYSNDRYSPLSQINPGTISTLSPVAIVQTGMTASFETTPIVVGGTMFLTTPVVNSQMKIMALNAATGERIWETTYNLGTFQICCGPVNRGVAVGYGKVYVVTLDDNLLALDATTGKLLWQKNLADPTLGYSETMAPQLYDGTVYVGSAGGEWAIRGFVAAFDANTGDKKWQWWSTDPKTYSGDSWKTGGAMSWTTPAIDSKLGLLILSTGNPNPDLYGTSREGDNKNSDSIVALDLKTGALRWAYQEVKHDVWDYDAVSNPLLFDVHQNGQTIPAAGEAGKVGWIFIVDRRTGKLIRKSAPYVMMSKNMFSMPTSAGVNMLPGANGGDEWSPPAYSPKTHDMYVPAMNQLMTFTTNEPKAGTGQIRLGSAFLNVKKGAIQNGPFVAVNMDTGKIAWQYLAPQPLIGGALATGGNLVFMGEGNGWFDAFNATTGQRVWRYQLGAGVNAPPITYEIGGKQYIAVAAGGNFQLGYPYGDAVAIFRLR